MTTLLLVIIYLAFISLGLPDGMLGAAWPTIYPEFAVPVSMMGVISFIIAAGTVISSLQSDRLTRRFGVGKVTAVSVGMTAAAILGFAASHSVLPLCLWAVPYGLGAGSIDAALNNFVALHYESRHMSWLHCMWGVGASLGPIIMGAALSHGQTWNTGYLNVGVIQVVLTAILFCSLPLWKGKQTSADSDEADAPAGRALSLREVLAVPGVWAVMIAFFAYCAIEQTAGQWSASYLVLSRGFSSAEAAKFASMFYLGVTIGRGISGFITFKLNDVQMIRLGFCVIAAGILLLLLPWKVCAVIGLIVVGLGCAPIYPSLIHSTPAHFGADKSAAIIGVQMASAYVGTTLIPPLFGLAANLTGTSILPFWILLFLALMAWQNSKLEKVSC